MYQKKIQFPPTSTLSTMFFALLLGSGFFSKAWAQRAEDPRFFDFDPNPTITLVEINPLSQGETLELFEENYPPSLGDFVGVIDGVEVILDRIINLGKKAWSVVENGRPVVNLKLDQASALPAGVTSWQQLSGWQTPISKRYQVTYKNPYGMNVVSFDYRVLFTYGGGVNGQGQYLSRISVSPAQVEVAWGYRFDVKAQVPNVVNTGTREQPIAGAEVEIEWVISTPVKYSQKTENFFVKGSGEIVRFD